VDATGSFTKYIYANGQRVAQRKDDAVISYLLTDPLGSTAITANTAGVETGELRYNPWGKERDSGYDASLTPTDYRFTDQRIETSFGLYHYDARWFDPTYGRFVQADTLIQDIRNPQLLDRYAYTLNNPVKYSDPTGHLVCSEVPWEEGCQMTEGQEDLMLATREYHKMILLQKRSDQTGPVSTLLKREVSHYNQTQPKPRGLKHVQTQQAPPAAPVDQQCQRSTREETQAISELLGR
jgi:RHS repeat-associated protein